MLAPKRIVQAVETSAAHSAAKVAPEAMGLRLITTLGMAMAAFSTGISGNITFATKPSTAHKKPTGKIKRPPKRKPLRADFTLLAPQAICTGP